MRLLYALPGGLSVGAALWVAYEMFVGTKHGTVGNSAFTVGSVSALVFGAAGLYLLGMACSIGGDTPIPSLLQHLQNSRFARRPVFYSFFAGLAIFAIGVSIQLTTRFGTVGTVTWFIGLMISFGCVLKWADKYQNWYFYR